MTRVPDQEAKKCMTGGGAINRAASPVASLSPCHCLSLSSYSSNALLIFLSESLHHIAATLSSYCSPALSIIFLPYSHRIPLTFPSYSSDTLILSSTLYHTAGSVTIILCLQHYLYVPFQNSSSYSFTNLGVFLRHSHHILTTLSYSPALSIVRPAESPSSYFSNTLFIFLSDTLHHTPLKLSHCILQTF